MVILDSAKAIDIVETSKKLYFTSSPFKVSRRQSVDLVLTCIVSNLKNVNLLVIRIPEQMKNEEIVSDMSGIYSRLYEGCENENIGDVDRLNYVKQRNPVFLGAEHDSDGGNRHGVIYDWITISKPGQYLLYGVAERNAGFLEKRTPAIVECF